MVLVVFLLAYLIRRRLDAVNRGVSEPVWRAWFQWGRVSRPGREHGIGRGLLLILVPAVAAGALEYLMRRAGLSLAVYPLEVLVLLLLMGTPGWRPALDAYAEAWARGDMQAAWHHVRDRLPPGERGAAVSPEAMHLSLCKAMLVTVFQRFFLVAFWFVVAGLPAAILARGLVALAEHWPQAAARPRFARLAEYAAWLPARLVSLTFGIAGDLAGWLKVARRALVSGRARLAEVLMVSANGALTGYALDPDRFSRLHPDEWPRFGGNSLSAIRDLLNRTMLVWLCLLALLVIAGQI